MKDALDNVVGKVERRESGDCAACNRRSTRAQLGTHRHVRKLITTDFWGKKKNQFVSKHGSNYLVPKKSFSCLSLELLAFALSECLKN